MSDNSFGSLNFPAVWALAAGGMAGGGIYTVLGVVVAISLQWSWLSFLIAGIIAFTSAFSYVKLANKFQDSGGAFQYLRDENREGIAGGLSWMLIIGYVLTVALYAFAFGHYISYGLGTPDWVTKLLAIGIVALLVGLNLLGAGRLSKVEIVIVCINLLALTLLGIYGLFHWDYLQLMAGAEPRPIWSAPIGAAAIFIGYEGFQLLTYEYDEIKNPQKILTPAIISAVSFVIIIYIIVALGAVMLAGALAIIDHSQVSLAIAAQQALGLPGLIIMVVAAALATAAAINSTLFSTAQLTKRVADDGELPEALEKQNSKGIPSRAVIILGILAAIISVIGSLSIIVEAASLVFLFTFGSVNLLAVQHVDKHKWIPWTGLILGAIITLILIGRLYVTAFFALSLIIGLVLIVIFVRPYILKKVSTDSPSSGGSS